MTTMTPTLQRAANDQRIIQRWLTDARRNGKKDVYTGKRRHPRFSWTVNVAVEIMDGGSALRPLFATTRDVSVGGVGLKVRQRIAAGTLVRIVRSDIDEHVYAKVQYCGEALGGFLVGVEFIQPPATSAGARGFNPASEAIRSRRVA